MRRALFAAALTSLVALTVLALAGAAAEVARKIVLQNVRVEVTERSIPPGGVREPYIRPTDQVIVFLNDASYDRIDSTTGETVRRGRKGGDVIWHSRGEFAPKLVNRGSEPFRSLIIAIK